ncbi:uncharacterized protein LOC132790508 [Drosophila nasuta]|uniref:uncharacterized protein LOC132790508 n=1 Tax=Drosophila nasuta TaxID=42062 RepID=UPI00295EA70F|nr:uncharacterized protein LOC132790508 [Drosophila nasuta]
MLIIETTYNEEEKLWHGDDMEVFYDTDITIGDVIFNALKENPKNICQVWHEKNEVISCEETLTMSVRLAQYFKDSGFTHEHVIGILSRNNVHDTHVMFACLFNATPFHAVNPLLEPDVIAALYAITKPKLIFCDGNDYELIKSITLEWNPIICTLINHIANVPKIEDHFRPTTTENSYNPTKLVIGENQTMGIICTSGTTGLPKAVTLSNAQLVLIGNTGGTKEVIFTNTAIDWISGIKTVLISTVSGAPRIVSNQLFSSERLVEIIKKHEVTVCHMSNWQFQDVFHSPLATVENLSSLQIITYGGGWVSANLVRAAQRTLPNTFFICLYGTSETDVVAAAINPSVDNFVGGLLPRKSVRILSEQGTYLGHNEIGEIIIKTNQNWSGYYGNAEQTAKTLDSDGWFYMGDLGYFDSDNNLYVVDRKKDLLRYKSFHYAPNDIEKIIMELPEVQSVCVVGIRDKLYNDAAGALIVKQPNSLLSEQQVIRHVAKRISVEYKQLHAGVKFVDTLPHNINGKLLRKVATEIFNNVQIPKAAL